MTIDPSIFVGLIAFLCGIFGLLIAIKVDIATIKSALNFLSGNSEKNEKRIQKLEDDTGSLEKKLNEYEKHRFRGASQY